MGWLFTISESFPILATFAMVYWLRSKGRTSAWPALFVILLINFVAQMLFGGLRGSRSNTIWGLFWTMGAIHYWLRPVTRTVVVVFTLFLVSFMYLYGFYKAGGPEAIEALRGGDSLENMSSRSGRTLAGAILGDLARSDVQAFALYRMSTPTISYDYAWGRSYLGAIALLIPGWLWPERPVTKVKWTTEIEYGPTWYDPGRWQSSRVYGAAGEAMLNFGPVAVPFAFLALGLIVKNVRRCAAGLRTGDSRQLLLPLLVMFCFIFLVSDSDNDVFFLVKFGLIPLLVVVLSSNRHLLSRRLESERHDLA
jgi:hypothetical protein